MFERILHSVFTLTLIAIRVDGCCWQPAVKQEVIKEIDRLLAIDKDHRACRRRGEQQVPQTIAFLGFIYFDDLVNVSGHFITEWSDSLPSV